MGRSAGLGISVVGIYDIYELLWVRKSSNNAYFGLFGPLLSGVRRPGISQASTLSLA